MTKTQTKAKKSERKPFKFKLAFDFSDSEWWMPEEIKALKKSTKVEVDDCGISIEMSGPWYRKAVKRIAEKAIASFFDDGLYFIVAKSGLQIVTPEDGRTAATVPWREICLSYENTEAAIAASKKWLRDELRKE